MEINGHGEIKKYYTNSLCIFPPICVFLQINMLLNFKDDKQECPCPEYIREQLLDFHEDLMRHCGLFCN